MKKVRFYNEFLIANCGAYEQFLLNNTKTLTINLEKCTNFSVYTFINNNLKKHYGSKKFSNTNIIHKNLPLKFPFLQKITGFTPKKTVISKSSFFIFLHNFFLNKNPLKFLMYYKFLNLFFPQEKTFNLLKKNLTGIFTTHSKFFFESRFLKLTPNTLIPSFYFSHVVKKKLMNITKKNTFHINILFWYHSMLIKFLENISGLKIQLLFNPFLENSLSFFDLAKINLWADRVFDFRRLLGPKIFIKESFKIFFLSMKIKDPSLLSSWIRQMLKRISFWKYRVLFRYIKYIVKNLFSTVFSYLQFKGFKLKLKGKISVGGNSRARTLMYRIGQTGQSTLSNKIVHDINYVYTFTGVMGFQIWFYF